jgi:hypothetical protein
MLLPPDLPPPPPTHPHSNLTENDVFAKVDADDDGFVSALELHESAEAPPGAENEFQPLSLIASLRSATHHSKAKKYRPAGFRSLLRHLRYTNEAVPGLAAPASRCTASTCPE